MNRRDASKTRQEQVFERDARRCAFCGATNFLELAHILPMSSGGDSSLDNLLTVCPNCHVLFDSARIRAFEFESFVDAVLRASMQYTDIQREFAIPNSNATADVIATRDKIHLLIECKALPAFIQERFLETLAQLDEYAQLAPDRTIVLATLGELTEQQKNMLQGRGYSHWGPRFFVENFNHELEKLPQSFIAKLIKFKAIRESRAIGEVSFRRELLDCPPGKANWSKYQRLIGNILEAFFVPPLEKTIIECSDEFKVNRRDFVLPNYCTAGFWEFLRQQYAADYIVVDAKNYEEEIKKKEILQIANYLKKHGLGLFALIFSRRGAHRSANMTMREQWALYGKMVVVLNDDDLIAMITVAESGGNPDAIIRQRIEEFRLSM